MVNIQHLFTKNVKMFISLLFIMKMSKEFSLYIFALRKKGTSYEE